MAATLESEMVELATATAEAMNRLNSTLRAEVGTDRGYNATWDILEARTLPGFAGDQVVLNAALAAHKAVYVTPEVGGLDIAATLIASQYGQRLSFMGSPQQMPINRRLNMTGSTLTVGTTSAPAGSAMIENLFFAHAGRGPMDYVEGAALTNKLTNGESHLEMHGAQGAILRNVGGYGCVHGISLFGCAETTLEKPFFYGGVWDPAQVSAQECLSQIHLASGSPWGRNDTITIKGCGLRPSQVTARRAVVISEKTVQVTRRIGPLHPLWVRSCENLNVDGGFIMGGAQSAVAISPDTAQPVFNIALNGVDIDESNAALIEVSATGSYVVGGLTISHCRLNGQLVTEEGIVVVPNGAGSHSLSRLKVVGTNIRATLGGGMRLLGVQGGEISSCGISGYNCARSVDVLRAGIYIDGVSSHIDTDNTRFGGGVNDFNDPTTADAYGISSNGTRLGLHCPSGAGGNITKGRLLNAPWGMSSPALSSGTFATDPT